MRGLSGYAITALLCIAIWVFGSSWMLYDFYYPSSQVWVIKPGPIILMLAMAVSVPVLLVCCVVLLRRQARG
jgi:hypothetical protein